MPKRLHGETRPKSPQKSFRGFVGIFVLLAVLFAAWVVWFGFVQSHWHTGWARSVVRVMPIPVASVEGEVIWYRDVSELANGYESLRELDAYSGFSLAVAELVKMKHAEHLAEELDVSVSTASDRSDEDLEDLLKATGWTPEQYQQYVTEPQRLAIEVESAVYAYAEYQEAALAEIEELARQVDSGVPFQDVASADSDHLSSEYGGDLGEVELTDLDPGLESIFDLEEGEVSEILETETYFAIVLVKEAFDGDDEEEAAVSAWMITVDKTGLAYALEEFATKQSVRIFLPGIVLE